MTFSRRNWRWPISGSRSSSSKHRSTPGLQADLEDRGVNTPVLPGILPVTSLASMRRLGGMGAAAPAWMQERLEAAHGAGGDEAVRSEGVQLATELCADLLKLDVPGLHFYTFNTSSATREIYAALGLGPALAATG